MKSIRSVKVKISESYIGQIVKWESAASEEGILIGHITGIALNVYGEPIAEVKVATYRDYSGREMVPNATTSEGWIPVKSIVRRVHFVKLTPISE